MPTTTPDYLNDPASKARRKLHIPGINLVETKEVLANCFVRAATELNLHPVLVAAVVAYFIDEAANQIIKGKIVYIPGFGSIGVRTKRYQGFPPGKPKLHIKPVVLLKKQIRLEAPLEPLGAWEKERERLRRRTKVNRGGTDRTGWVEEYIAHLFKVNVNYDKVERFNKRHVRWDRARRQRRELACA